MRILIKGGVWKNTEDEILKAAVMKYGKNQWARVASLLNRKSAKQCKARWYEWLDPSIKKTEWTREEEEKLLHLAKLMPHQWRTIAPIVGRTAGQCMEHYEKLLDQAQAEDEAEDTTAQDARRLRPGEIDPTPETKPARPDPIDMDEDEKEMLSEARARLANTKGKKAKRKARERMLQESRRLAMLQKRRELKAAGIESRLGAIGNKKRNFVDFIREVPFQKVPPVGFYDVSDENADSKKMELDISKHNMELNKLEGRREKDETERQRQRDKKLMKDLYKENAPLAVMKVSEQADPVSLRKRMPLTLPSPQLSESDLEDIVKLSKSMQQPQLMNQNAEELGGFTATEGLMGDYSEFLKPTHPMTGTSSRTPQYEDVIMQEARNLRALNKMTPLMSQELPELYEGTGFQGITPRRSVQQTPNQLALNTPSRNIGSSTPSVFGGGEGSTTKGSKFGSMVIRDSFGLNTPSSMAQNQFDNDAFSVSEVSASMNSKQLTVGGSHNKAFARQMQQQLLSKLQSLPEPEFAYEVSLPSSSKMQEDDDENERILRMKNKPEDAADRAIRLQREEARKLQAELERRSTVLKQGLPRPIHGISKDVFEDLKSKEINTIDQMIEEEMIELIAYEDRRYPVENDEHHLDSHHDTTERYRGNRSWQPLAPSEMEAARRLISTEQRQISEEELEQCLDSLKMHRKRQLLLLSASEVNDDDGADDDNDEEGNDGNTSDPNQKKQIQALMSEFGYLVTAIEQLRKRRKVVEDSFQDKLEEARLKQYESKIADLLASNTTILRDIEGIERVREQERRAAQNRLDRGLEEALAAEQLESENQKKYSELVAFARKHNIAF
jgi:pre-mRNA-splicing factor CDC5/CEF1